MKEVIVSHAAPAAIGPYSQAIKVGNMVFLSGQIPLDPDTGTLVVSDIGAQTHRVMGNLRAVLEAAGGDLANLVKTTIFLANMEDFAQVNAIYGSYFETAPPARATIQVSRLPKDVAIEIEGIAVL